MVDRRKVSPGHHEHDDRARSAALRRSPGTVTPCRADVDVSRMSSLIGVVTVGVLVLVRRP